jgi:hypothetical protein
MHPVRPFPSQPKVLCYQVDHFLVLVNFQYVCHSSQDTIWDVKILAIWFENTQRQFDSVM